MTIPQQRTLTHIRRAGISVILGLGLVLLGTVAVSYRATNTSATVGSTALLRSGATYDWHSDELIPECMVHVCVQRPAAFVAEQSLDELIPECMVHVCVQRPAAHVVERTMDELLPECMIHVCVEPQATSVYDDR